MPTAEYVRRFAAVTVIVSTVILVGYTVLGAYLPDNPILDLGGEDGVVEYLSAILWGAASVVCGYRLLTGRGPRVLLAFWLVLAFVSMGEEVSWFQRLLGIQTPEEIAAINRQGEINLHNLDLPFSTQNAFRLGFIAYFLLLPILSLWTPVRRLGQRFGYVVPHLSFLIMTWSVIALSVVLDLIGPAAAERVLIETQEAYYAFVVLAYVSLYLRPIVADDPPLTAQAGRPV
jgi:hypothetical protein